MVWNVRNHHWRRLGSVMDKVTTAKSEERVINATSDTVILDAELRTAENACEAMRSKNSIIKQTKTEQQYEEANKGYLWEDEPIYETHKERIRGRKEQHRIANEEQVREQKKQYLLAHNLTAHTEYRRNQDNYQICKNISRFIMQTTSECKHMEWAKETSADIAWTQWSHLRTRTRGQHVKQSSRALQLLHHHSKCENRSRINSALLEVAFRVTMSKIDATVVNKWVRIVTNQGIQ